MSSNPTITDHRKVHDLIKEMYNTFFYGEQCELVLIGLSANPELVERLKNDIGWLVTVVDVRGQRRTLDGDLQQTTTRAIDPTLNLGLIVHDGGEVSQFQSAAFRELAFNNVMTITLGV